MYNQQDESDVVPSKARITAIGSYAPEKVLTNNELEQMVETNNEWIIQRTGIKERRIAGADEYTSDLSVRAVENMLERYDQSVDDVDLIIVSTSTADFSFPSVASQVQGRFGMKQAGALDLGAACAGFAYGLHVANGMITAGLHRKVLVIGAETMSKITDYTDRTTCILFGDGAGVVLVERDEENPSFLSSHLEAKGEGGIHLYQSTHADRMGTKAVERHGFIVQNGREVYKWAVKAVPQGIQKVLNKTELGIEQVDWFVPHSANLRMIESICTRSGVPMERTLQSLEYFGNTSAASIPLALDSGVRDGRVKAGDHIMLYGFGGGLVHAGVLIKWTA